VGATHEERADSGVAWGLVVAAAVLAGIAMAALPLPIGPAAIGWAALLGITFQQWLELVSQRGNTQDLRPYTWVIPVAAIAASWVRRRDPLGGAAAGGTALLLALWPGLARYAVLPNALTALVPIIAVLALLSWRQQSSRDRGILLVLAVGCSASARSTRNVPHPALPRCAFLGRGNCAAAVLGGRLRACRPSAAARVVPPHSSRWDGLFPLIQALVCRAGRLRAFDGVAANADGPH
jgi:hypothetical protein